MSDDRFGDSEVSLNLGNVETQWSLVRRAHDTSLESAAVARQALVMRYAPAIRRFMQIVARDNQLADELSQEAIVRVLQGDFAGADPQRGRFRDLLKTALRNMARNYWSAENRAAKNDVDLSLLEDSADHEAELEAQWAERWRENVLAITWQQLKAAQESQHGSVMHTVLKLRSEFPDESSSQLAQRLSKATGRSFNDVATRQQLRRARRKFAQLLIAEVAQGLEEPSAEVLQDELIAIGLYASVKDALPRNDSG